MAKSKRFEARIDPQLEQDIRALADMLEIDKSELARRALSLYLIAKTREIDEGEVISMFKDGRKTVELVGV